MIQIFHITYSTWTDLPIVERLVNRSLLALKIQRTYMLETKSSKQKTEDKCERLNSINKHFG
jgi:hypothetical protein